MSSENQTPPSGSKQGSSYRAAGISSPPSFKSRFPLSPNKTIGGDRYIPMREDHAQWQMRFSPKKPVSPHETTLTASRRANSEPQTPELIAYQSLLKNELLNHRIDTIRLPNENELGLSPNSLSARRCLFSYQSQHAGSSAAKCKSADATPPTPSSYSLAPITPESQQLLQSPHKVVRKVPKVPYKVLDAPELQDDFYLNLIDWSSANVLAVGLGSSVYLWSAKTSQVTKLCDLSSDNDTVTSVGWSDKGGSLAVGTSKGYCQIWDVDSSKRVHNLTGHTSRIGCVAWNGDLICSGSRDRTIVQRDLRLQGSAEAGSFITRILGHHKQEVCGLKWSPDKQYLASGGNDNKLLVWALNSANPVQVYGDHNAAVKAIAWSPHHRGLLASGGGTADRHIRFWNTVTGQAMRAVDTGSQVCNIAWSKHTSELVSTHGYSQNQVIIWKYPSLQHVAKLTGHTYRVLYLAMSPDGETVVTGAGDETLRFWNVFSFAEGTMPDHSTLSNDDFRKLLATPRVPAGGEGSAGAEALAGGGVAKDDSAKKLKRKGGSGGGSKGKRDDEDDSLTNILSKYRDRAKERRDGGGVMNMPSQDDVLRSSSGYKAVAPDLRTNLDNQEKRKKMIQESKYLGGDLEHTHLVKGLDFALLQKVRAEIATKGREGGEGGGGSDSEEDIESTYQKQQAERKKQAAQQDSVQCVSATAKAIVRRLFLDETPKVNPLFAPRRMAYVVELEAPQTEAGDHSGEHEDIPTTLIRSVAECPQEESQSSLSANDMIIQKLSSVLSYLRADGTKKKHQKKGGLLAADMATAAGSSRGNKSAGKAEQSLPIYDESELKTGAAGGSRKDRDVERGDRRRDRDDTRRDRDRQRDRDHRERDRRRDRGERERRRSRSRDRERGSKREDSTRQSKQAPPPASEPKRDHPDIVGLQADMRTQEEKGIRMSAALTDSYSECYPDAVDFYNPNADDSDDDADYSKMDLGNKKGPVRRWDFENEQDYEKYMSQREAMPKAAFQYGRKMDDGRKTRKHGGPGGGGRSERDERVKLDREWQQISALISKRKGGDGGAKKAKLG